MGRIKVCASAFVFLAFIFIEAPTGRASSLIRATIDDVSTDQSLVWVKRENGKVEAVGIGKNCQVLLDGEEIAWQTLKPGQRVTIHCGEEKSLTAFKIIAIRPTPTSQAYVSGDPSSSRGPRTDRDKGAIAFIPSGLSKKQREEAETAVNLRTTQIEISAKIEESRRLAIAEWQANLTAKMQAAQAQAIQQHAYGFDTRYSSPFEGRIRTNEEKYQAAVAKCAGAWIANAVSDSLKENDDLGSLLGAEMAHMIRDECVKSALKDVFPKANDLAIRGIARVATQYWDGRLTTKNLVIDTGKEELIEALKKGNPEIGACAEVADFIVAVSEIKHR